VADSLSEEVELISFEVPLAKADVIDNLFVVVASVAVLALDENTRCVDVLLVDSEDDVNLNFGCSVVGWTVVVVSSLAVVRISVITDGNVSGTFTEDVKLLSCDVMLALAEVIVALFVAVTSAVVLILDENIVRVVVSRVDREDDSNSSSQ